MGRLRMASLIVGPHIVPMTQLEVTVIAEALAAYADVNRQLLRREADPTARQPIARRASLARKLTEMLATGNPVESSDAIDGWRARRADHIRRRLGRPQVPSLTIQITHGDADRDPWMEEADRRLAERDNTPDEGEGESDEG
jgi:hypothetical protein